ncbi:hypothetical protein DGG96_08410 [Legionella qingyii]|uniref:Uncharacterized protein n=1 Tax=Legionella qingyii TaxID=2184757 RepID=A0A317U4H3_9GAMM|nr:hypothetical protein DGG96_08410 [Legionella qingyii]
MHEANAERRVTGAPRLFMVIVGGQTISQSAGPTLIISGQGVLDVVLMHVKRVMMKLTGKLTRKLDDKSVTITV